VQVRRGGGVAGQGGVETRQGGQAAGRQPTGLSVRRTSSPYHSTICTQWVSSAVGAERADGGLGLQAVAGEGCLEHVDAVGVRSVPDAARGGGA